MPPSYHVSSYRNEDGEIRWIAVVGGNVVADYPTRAEAEAILARPKTGKSFDSLIRQPEEKE